MLRGFRELGLSASELRSAVTQLRGDDDDEYALATRAVATDGMNLLVNMAPSLEDSPQWVRARGRQGSIAGVIDQYLKRRPSPRRRSAGQPRRDFLQQPAVAIRVAERGEVAPNWIELPEPGGVNWTIQTPLSKGKSASSLHPSLS